MAKVKKTIAAIISLLVFTGGICMSTTSASAEVGSRFTLSQARILAMNGSRDCKSLKSKIILKQVEYVQAVKSITLKKKNMATFRWTPLLSFKFPEKADLADAYEFTYKPLQIQSEISSLKHQLEDVKYEVYEKVSNLYTEVYTYQQTIAYREKQLESLKDTLERNKVRLAVGQAEQSDIDSLEAQISTLESAIAGAQRQFEQSKKKLSELVKLDVTSGYTFTNPYVESEISRDMLEAIVETTLEKSQTYYDVKLNTKLALTSLDTNYSLMENQYGGKMGYISSYVKMAKAGNEIDTSAFKLSYDSFLNAIDSPWVGKKKILFIKIPKEWFKGSIDGVRYVEDEPYALYTSVLEYADALSEQQQTEKEIRNEVESGFENLVTARNGYLSLKKQSEEANVEMKRGELLNKTGELEFSQYEELKDSYEALEMEELEALKLYTQVLYSYDRLTCGAITDILKETSGSLSTGTGGQSFITEDLSDGAYYYIESKVADNIFELGIYIPEDCQVSVNGFELWVDDIQIGERTEVGKLLRHLTLAMENASKVVIRLYEDDNFVADAQIDPGEYYGKLPIIVTKKEEAGKKKVASYVYRENKSTNMVTVEIEPVNGEEIAYFRLADKNGNYIMSSEPVAVTGGLTYLSLLIGDLEEVKAELFDEKKEKLYDGTFNKSDMYIYTAE